MPRDHYDIWGGLLLAAVGLFVAVYSGTNYAFGTLARMGPGFFPTILGGVLAVLGLAVAVPAWSRAGEKRPIHWREGALVLVSIVLFGVGLSRLGIVVTTAATVGLASLASTHPGVVWRIVLAGVLAAMAWAIFIAGLRMAIPVWPQVF